MFHDIPQVIFKQMKRLEAIDTRDREDGTPRMERLRQIPPVTGRFLALMAATALTGEIIEIGASAGYSTLWLALAARATGRHVTTFELLPEKAKLARETFRLAEVEDVVELIEADALDRLPEHKEIGFCFLDGEKELYQACYDLVIPKLIPGGLLMADNAISHGDFLQPMLESVLADSRVDALVVPVGKGELLCRKH